MNINIKEILCMDEDELRFFITEFLRFKKISYTVTKDYIITRQHDKVVPLICTHTDTISFNPTHQKFIVDNDGILSTVKPFGCLGADDRAGVWIALKMMETKTITDFEYGFFVAEETGAKGSSAFALEQDLSKYSCFIGLDRASRAGKQNVACYGYDNDELTQLFIDYGFVKQSGSFSDCSNLSGYSIEDSPRACVNISVGYQHEHSIKESLSIALMEDTLNMMRSILIPEQEYTCSYKPQYTFGNGGVYGDWQRKIWGDYIIDDEGDDDEWLDIDKYGNEILPVVCDFCGEHKILYDFQGSLVCADCIDLCNR